MPGLLGSGGDPKRKDWIYNLAMQTGQVYFYQGNSNRCSNISSSGFTFTKKGKVRIRVFIKTEGEYYNVQVKLNGSTIVKSEGYDGDKSYNAVHNVSAGNYMNFSVGGGYTCRLVVCVNEE